MSGLGIPAKGTVTRQFGTTNRDADPSAYMADPVRGKYLAGGAFTGSVKVPNAHLGQDIANASGTPIVAVERGVILLHIFDGDRGWYVVEGIHKNAQGRWDTVIEYQHCQASGLAPVGTRLPRLGQLGRMGSTGDSTGPHLHWAVAHAFAKYPDYHFWQTWFQWNPKRLQVGGADAGVSWIVPNF